MSDGIRRKRGVDTVQFHAHVRPHVRDRVKALAEAYGVTQWSIVEAAIMYGAEQGNVIPAEWNVETPNGDPLPIEFKKSA